MSRWPGSAHDSRIFQNSSIKLRFDEGEIRGILLGDSGYAQSEYLFTPILNPQSEGERRYTNAHVKTRICVERCFGVWKRRFPCLSKKMGNKVTTVSNIICACAVLHNISIEQGEVSVDEYSQDPGNYDSSDDLPPTATQRRGAVIKRLFIERHFQ